MNVVPHPFVEELGLDTTIVSYKADTVAARDALENEGRGVAPIVNYRDQPVLCSGGPIAVHESDGAAKERVQWALISEIGLEEVRQPVHAIFWFTLSIFCVAAVLVYFDALIRHEILGKVRQLLRPDGYFFLGGAETVLPVDESFKAVRGDGFSYYQLNGT